MGIVYVIGYGVYLGGLVGDVAEERVRALLGGTGCLSLLRGHYEWLLYQCQAFI